MSSRQSRTRACIASYRCWQEVAAHCTWRRPNGDPCGVGLCRGHQRGAPEAPRCAMHQSVAEPLNLGNGDPRCSTSGSRIGDRFAAEVAAAGEIYCAGCRVHVPVRDGKLVHHSTYWI